MKPEYISPTDQGRFYTCGLRLANLPGQLDHDLSTAHPDF